MWMTSKKVLRYGEMTSISDLVLISRKMRHPFIHLFVSLPVQTRQNKALRGTSLSKLKRMGSKLASKTRKAISERFGPVEHPPIEVDVRVKRDPTKVQTVLKISRARWPFISS